MPLLLSLNSGRVDMQLLLCKLRCCLPALAFIATQQRIIKFILEIMKSLPYKGWAFVIICFLRRCAFCFLLHVEGKYGFLPALKADN